MRIPSSAPPFSYKPHPHLERDTERERETERESTYPESTESISLSCASLSLSLLRAEPVDVHLVRVIVHVVNDFLVLCQLTDIHSLSANKYSSSLWYISFSPSLSFSLFLSRSVLFVPLPLSFFSLVSLPFFFPALVPRGGVNR